MKSELVSLCSYVKEKVKVQELDGHNYISTENMLSDKGGITEAASLPSVSQTQKYQKGDVLVSNIRPYFKKIWLAEYDGGCSNDVLVFRARENCDPTFLYYVLSNDTFFEYATATSKGTKMPRGDKTAIMRYCVPEVEITEQRRISELLCGLDNKIKNNKRVNDNLEQQANILIAHYVDSVGIATKLGDIMSFENGFAFRSDTYCPVGKYRIITIKNVQDGKIDSQGASCINIIPSNMKQSCFLNVGDVLLSLTGNVGRVGIVFEENMLLNQRVAKLIPNEKDLIPWLYFYFRLPSTKTTLESISKGTAQQNLSPVETLNIQVPFEIESARELSNVFLPLYKAVLYNNMESLRLSMLRDTLLPKLMSGELDVSDISL